MEAKVGETVRIFFGVGGPNYTSSFHVIGEIFDKVYNLGGVLSEPLRGVQTVTVPAGGAVITEFKLDVPGNFTLVDHALSRWSEGWLESCMWKGNRTPKSSMAKLNRDPATNSPKAYGRSVARHLASSGLTENHLNLKRRPLLRGPATLFTKHCEL